MDSQIKKGFLEFCILLVISRGDVYTSDIIDTLKQANLIVVEGTLYPLLSRLRKEQLVDYKWVESPSGPPRKYYSLAEAGRAKLSDYRSTWTDLQQTINLLIKSHE
jgi:PadR family transcriptional regulator, regulatory protein PadR